MAPGPRTDAPAYDNGGVTLIWRPLTRDDAPAIATLLTVAAEHDGTHEVVTSQMAVEMFDQPRFVPRLDTTSGWADGDLVAIGSVTVIEALVESRALVFISGTVHPEHRGQGIGSGLLHRLERRAATAAAEHFPEAPVRFRTSGGLVDSDVQRLLEAAGYVPDNYFVTMQVDLESWDDPGQASSAVAPDAGQLAAARDAHNDAFRDHRNFSPVAADRWAFWMGTSTSRPELARVVLEGDRVLAYAMSGEEEPGVLHTNVLGTRREARGRGLARQVLLATLRAAREAGYAVSELEVDQTSPTGADRLYAAVGYRPVRVISRFVKDAQD